MKRIIFTSLLVLLVGITAHAQAVLPTSWSFPTTTMPTGWTTTGTAYYTASGNTPPALKFDNTADDLVINFNSNPGNLSYYLAGNSFSGGTFTVEESDLGTVWTTLHTHTAPTNAVYTQYTDVPQTTTRYIRFIYTNKVAGNVGLDDVSIAVGAAGPQQEINVKQGTTTIVSGGTHSMSSPVSTTTPVTFTIENLGTANTLNISSAVVTGPNASEFVVASSPSTVAATSTGSVVINFTPTVAGTRTAVLTINSDDADEAAYVINLNGIGGTFASEPTAQATNLQFSNVKTYRVTGTFTAAAGSPDGYIVLRKTGSAITGIPTDGMVYDRGDIVGDAQVVFSGTGNTFTPNNIVASTGYYFAVYTYNGSGSFRNYLTAAPLTGNTTTPATMQPANYYNGISTASPTFVADLHALINPHDMQFYSNYGNLMIAQFAARDTVDDQRVITCVYSGENHVYTEPFDFTTNGYSREHTYCHSWMPTNPAQSLPEYNDYHHLFPTNQNQANAVRSNYPLGEVVNVQSTFLGAKYGTDANGHIVYEPRDAHKGDAARAMMYEATCYTTVSANNWGFPNPISASINYGQDQAILKQWNYQDPPSNWEIARNDYIDSLQDNRNPFVDNIDYVCYINFTNMSYEAAGCTANIDEILSNAFIVYPNPATDLLTLNVDATTINGYQILDMQGRLVLSSDVSNQVVVKVDCSSLKAGSYLVKASTPYGTAQRSLVIE